MKFCKVLSSNKRYFQALRDNCLEGEGGGEFGKLEGGIGENDNKREGGWM